MMKIIQILTSSLLALLLPALASAQTYRGAVIDVETKQPIAEAMVTLGDVVVSTDTSARFQVSGDGEQLGVRAYGYQRRWVITDTLSSQLSLIELTRLTPKALYLSSYGIASARLRQAALDLLEATELNALVIDVKGDRGMIAYKSAIPLAAAVGAQKLITIKDLPALVATLREKGIYTIARIVTFKDHPLATAHPELAVKAAGGGVWRDRERLGWSDPFKKEVRDYNIAVAVEAAKAGFDEIQFDYVRFPDKRGLRFALPSSEKSRVAAISAFLDEAREQLKPYNVFLAADIFGYVCWNLNDTGIGQRVEDLILHLDYISPMVYPSCYHVGIPGVRNPVAHPYEIVYRSLARARERTRVSSRRFRPWLQAFRDYAFDRRAFTGHEIRTQIRAAEDFGANGWMLWNAGNVYSADGLQRTDTSAVPWSSLATNLAALRRINAAKHVWQFDDHRCSD
jgi:hypothetical protein